MNTAPIPAMHETDTEILDRVIKRLVDSLNPIKIVLFGSRARGEAREDSDFDILVIADTPNPPHVRMAAAQRALRGIPAAVDVFVCTPQEVEQYGKWLSHTVAVALNEGIVLHAEP